MDQRPEATYGDLFAFLRRHLPIALVLAAVAAASAFVLSSRLEPTFEAQARLLVAQPTPELRNFGGMLMLPSTVDATVYREAAMTDAVLADTVQRLGVEAPTAADVRALRQRLEVRVDATGVSSIIDVSARHGDPVAAADEANALAAALAAWDSRRAAASVRRIVDTLENQLIGIDQQISTLRAQGAAQAVIDEQLAVREAQRQQLSLARTLQSSAIGLIETFELAMPPTEAVAPRPLRTALLVGVVGLLLAYALMLLRSSLDTRVRSIDELRRVTGLKVLAEFRPVRDNSKRLAREATSYLRTNIHYALPGAGGTRVLVVTGTDRSTGTFPVSMSLAESYARNGQRTVLIDADLRKAMPRAALAKEYDLLSLGQPSLREQLEHPERSVHPTEIDLGGGASLGFIASFHPAPYPSELLSREFAPLLTRLHDYDVVVVDAAPVLAVADALIVAPHADGIVLVVDMAAADRAVLGSAVKTLEPVRSRLLGAVAINVPRERAQPGAYAYRDEPREVVRERGRDRARERASAASASERRAAAREVGVGRRA